MLQASDLNPRPSTTALEDLPSGGADDESGGPATAGTAVDRDTGNVATLVSSPPPLWDLRSVYLGISFFSTVFATMVDAGEVQTSRAVALM